MKSTTKNKKDPIFNSKGRSVGANSPSKNATTPAVMVKITVKIRKKFTIDWFGALT